MVTLESLAEAALRCDNLRLRSLTQEFLRDHPQLNCVSPPTTTDPRLRTIAAALVELLAQRGGQVAPVWTRDIGAMTEPLFLVKAATRMRHLRSLCESEAPEPLRKRRLYAPPDFLTFA